MQINYKYFDGLESAPFCIRCERWPAYIEASWPTMYLCLNCKMELVHGLSLCANENRGGLTISNDQPKPDNTIAK